MRPHNGGQFLRARYYDYFYDDYSLLQHRCPRSAVQRVMFYDQFYCPRRAFGIVFGWPREKTAAQKCTNDNMLCYGGNRLNNISKMCASLETIEWWARNLNFHLLFQWKQLRCKYFLIKMFVFLTAEMI